MPGSTISTFTDPYEYQNAIRATTAQLFVSTAGTFKANLTRIDLHRLWMQRGKETLGRVAHSALTPSRSSVFFLADDQLAPIHRHRMEISPGEILFHGRGAEAYHRSFAECRWGAMSLTPDDLTTAGRAITGYDLIPPTETRLIRPPSKLMERLLSLHKAAGELAATVPDIIARPEVARALEQELVRVMVRCLTEGIAPEPDDHRHARVPVMRRFEQVLKENPDQPLHVSEICAAIGVADRTLRLHCMEHLGMSPQPYLWLRRMNFARRALSLADPAKSTVTEIATGQGFWELGRFAISYRRLFGESPSETLRSSPRLVTPHPAVQPSASSRRFFTGAGGTGSILREREANRSRPQPASGTPNSRARSGQ